MRRPSFAGFKICNCINEDLLTKKPSDSHRKAKRKEQRIKKSGPYAIPEFTYEVRPFVHNKVTIEGIVVILCYYGIKPLKIYSAEIGFLSENELDIQLRRNIKLPTPSDRADQERAINENIENIRFYLNYLPYVSLRDAAIDYRAVLEKNDFLDDLLNSLEKTAIADDFFLKRPVFYYLREKINSLMLNTLLVEFIFQKEVQPSTEESKIGNRPNVDYVSYFLEYENLIRKIKKRSTVETYTEAKSTIDSYKHSLAALKTVLSEKELVKKSVTAQILHKKMEHLPTEKNISLFKDIYLLMYDTKFVLDNIPGAAEITNSENPTWVPYELTTYWCFLLSYINQKHFLLKKCDRYKNRRRLSQNHSPGNEFIPIIKKYQSMHQKANALLAEIKGKASPWLVDLIDSNSTTPDWYHRKNKKAERNVEYACNKFLFSNLLHQDFFTSVESPLFEILSNMCSFDLLLKYNSNTPPTVDEQSAYLSYDLLMLFLKYDINLDKLWNNIQQEISTVEDINTLVKLIYRFLVKVDNQIEACVGSCLSALMQSPFEDINYFWEDHTIEKRFFKEFESFFMDEPVSIDSIPKFSYDVKKQLLFTQLLLHNAIR